MLQNTLPASQGAGALPRCKIHFTEKCGFWQQPDGGRDKDAHENPSIRVDSSFLSFAEYSCQPEWTLLASCESNFMPTIVHSERKKTYKTKPKKQTKTKNPEKTQSWASFSCTLWKSSPIGPQMILSLTSYLPKFSSWMDSKPHEVKQCNPRLAQWVSCSTMLYK